MGQNTSENGPEAKMGEAGLWVAGVGECADGQFPSCAFENVVDISHRAWHHSGSRLESGDLVPQTCCVALAKSLTLSGPLFPCCSTVTVDGTRCSLVSLLAPLFCDSDTLQAGEPRVCKRLYQSSPGKQLIGDTHLQPSLRTPGDGFQDPPSPPDSQC